MIRGWTRTRSWTFLGAALCIGLQGAGVGQAQTEPVPRPGAVEAAPLGSSGSPPAAITQDAPPATTPPVPAPPATSAQGLPTLIPEPGDTVNVDEVVLPARPVAMLSGTSTWDDGFANLRAAFRRIEDAATKAGMRPAGRPIAVFTQTDDLSFHYQAMVPVTSPEGSPPLPPEIRMGTTPSGKAYRFVHKGAYDTIDSTYETITAYLDAKDIVARDAFIEEYAVDVPDASDANLEINIFVQPK